ncbi:hypothetical protein GPJ56_005712 [Histomonas meleagridis]|uniref:uncharacterized protein n=1 Tax=Histomonas meleagridis TaxID=135588 RepID=UPI0035599779|nr:hypothetical protein GPJ56_005712 [Histomonas meleagridis]KAH0803352.1 hypothetical protein GO595_003696 [Histomonas meleagridis]
MKKSLVPALPSLRPASPSLAETPRGTFTSSIASKSPKYNSDFEVNRSLFLTQSKKHSTGSPRSPKKQRVTPNMQLPKIESPNKSPNPELLQIKELTERIPDNVSSIEENDIYKLSPILDRILCVISSWEINFIQTISNDPIIISLQQKLFGLIDINDFLLRTIICRILLTFATSPSSPLLLPVSRIFYKLSCDQSNDQFFYDESLDEVLIKLIRISQPESRVFAAGALRNIASFGPIREKLNSNNFINFLKEIFEDEKSDSLIKIQLLGATRQMCKSHSFRKTLSEQEFLVKELMEPETFNDALKTVFFVQELNVDKKLTVLKYLNGIELNDDQTKLNVVKSLSVLSVGTEGTNELENLIIKLIKCIDEQDALIAIMKIANRCTEKSVDILGENATVFVKLLENQDYDTTLKRLVYQILKKIKRDDLSKIISENSFLEKIS